MFNKKRLLVLKLATMVVLFQADLMAQYEQWQYNGSFHILTTPEGANLPVQARLEGFPLLFRLNGDWFDFSQSGADGHDIRFSSEDGTRLAYEIEEWDPVKKLAAIWIRIPVIKGNSQQSIRMHWGNSNSKSESNGKAVFNETNGYLSVWHLGKEVRDEVGTLRGIDSGTLLTPGMVGQARHFPGKKGIYCGDKIESLPTGSSVNSTQAWFRSDQSKGRLVGWGNEKAQGKIVMQYRSPPQVWMECYFSDANVGAPVKTLPPAWTHVVHTYQKGRSLIYVNGLLAGTGNPRASVLALERPARMWLGGWYGNYDFVGDLDEVRISSAVRSADWIRLEYENQNPLQTAVGHLVRKGNEFSVSHREVILEEGTAIDLTAKAGGAQKIYWQLQDGDDASVQSVDRFGYSLKAGRVTGDRRLTLKFKAVYRSEVKTRDISILIKESIPEPVFTLEHPKHWNGRETIEVVPRIANREAMLEKGEGELVTRWKVNGLAVIKEVSPKKLILKRAQNSGDLQVTATLSNGGDVVESTATIGVRQPTRDDWVRRLPGKDEKPVDNQFYARDDSNRGTLYYNGRLTEPGDSVFLKVYADNRLVQSLSQEPDEKQQYAFAVKLKPGLIRYRVEFGVVLCGAAKIHQRVENLVCGDAYLINGQSNALATDTQEKSPPETSPWIRSYGKPTGKRPVENLWCLPVWKAEKGESAELGYWGMELAKGLVKAQQMPIFMINGAVGGTRIDQHQRNQNDPADLDSIYGRMLWRVQQAGLTHGIRAILWHQGENDQGAAGPDGGYGWESYERYFLEMSAGWKEDFPNVKRYYIFQIWPNACSMGNGNGDMLREVQRNLPRLYSNLEILSTLGIRPGGSCHYPLKGWAEFARLVQPLLERDFYGRKPSGSITPPNLKKARFEGQSKMSIVLEFDQPVVWKPDLTGQFLLDGMAGSVIKGVASGNVLTLSLKEGQGAQTISYLSEKSWSQDRLLLGKNEIAALSFCNVPIE